MKRTLVAALLGIAAIAASGTTFAYWASSVAASSDTAVGTVTIGEGNEVTTTVTVADQTASGLVPVGFAVDPGEVEFVVLQFTVAWDSTNQDAAGHTGTLAVTLTDLEIDGLTTYASLVTTAVQIGGTVTGATLNADGSTAIVADGADVTVFVKLTLAEPSTRAIYDAVATKDITFTATFAVTPAA